MIKKDRNQNVLNSWILNTLEENTNQLNLKKLKNVRRKMSTIDFKEKERIASEIFDLINLGKEDLGAYLNYLNARNFNEDTKL